MLNFDNINDVEFEYLCKDIMEAKLKTELRRFAPGKDGGIDLTDDLSTNNIVVQVKHYRKTSQENTVSALKKEVAKVKKLDPNEYHVCIARELSPDKTKAIYDMFSDYMESEDNILTIIEINDFLEKEENIEILKKHYKLWLCSTGILENIVSNDLFIDCETMISGFENKAKLFVKTTAFDRALQCLENHNILFITGQPGVGKTITSEMLVMHFSTQGYTVRYTTNSSDLSVLKRSLSRDKDKNEIIFIDDCFGQIYFKMRDSQSKELLALIKYVNLHPNKLLLLNSRVTIYNEAKERNTELIESFYEKEYKVFVLDMSETSLKEKALILYNHLYFKNVPEELLNEVKKDKRYRLIVSHNNYNPRIIERICNAAVRDSIPAEHYFDYIILTLNNPKDMWNDEYENRIQPTDRLLLTTLYSLTDTYVDAEILRTCYERRISGYPGIDNTIGQFERSMARLNESFITITDYHGTERVSVVNPSVNDYLKARLSKQSAESEELNRSLCHIQQMTNMLTIIEFNKWEKEVVREHQVDDYIFTGERQKRAFIVYNISSCQLCDEYYQETVEQYLLNPSKLRYYAYPEATIAVTLIDLLTDKLFSFYHMAEILEFCDYNKFFEDAYLEELVELIKLLDDKIPDNKRDEYLETADCYIRDAVEAYFIDIDISDLDLNVERAVKMNMVYDEGEPECDIDAAVEMLDDEIKEQLIDEVSEILLSLPSDLSLSQWEIESLYSTPYGVEDLVESYLPDFDEDKYREEQDISITPPEINIDEIDAIFER